MYTTEIDEKHYAANTHAHTDKVDFITLQKECAIPDDSAHTHMNAFAHTYKHYQHTRYSNNQQAYADIYIIVTNPNTCKIIGHVQDEQATYFDEKASTAKWPLFLTLASVFVPFVHLSHPDGNL